jgi:hypothetical protein
VDSAKGKISMAFSFADSKKTPRRPRPKRWTTSTVESRGKPMHRRDRFRDVREQEFSYGRKKMDSTFVERLAETNTRMFGKNTVLNSVDTTRTTMNGMYVNSLGPPLSQKRIGMILVAPMARKMTTFHLKCSPKLLFYSHLGHTPRRKT